MPRLSSTTRIALGQTFLVATILTAAMGIGLVPDHSRTVMEGRAALSEVIATSTSVMIQRGNLERSRAILQLAVQRNSDLLSAGVRRADGYLLVEAGDHARNWPADIGKTSTDEFMHVPVLSGGREWGSVEMRYRSIGTGGVKAALSHPSTRLVLVVSLATFFVFCWYLKRVLTRLDPAKAIPSRVRSLLDTLSSGVVVLDGQRRIVLANEAFAEMSGEEFEQLQGRDLAELAWTSPEAAAGELPWTEDLQIDGLTRRRKVAIQTEFGRQRTLWATVSALDGSDGSRQAALVEFVDLSPVDELAPTAD